jgi:hypothetical protein
MQLITNRGVQGAGKEKPKRPTDKKGADGYAKRSSFAPANVFLGISWKM